MKDFSWIIEDAQRMRERPNRAHTFRITTKRVGHGVQMLIETDPLTFVAFVEALHSARPQHGKPGELVKQQADGLWHELHNVTRG